MFINERLVAKKYNDKYVSQGYVAIQNFLQDEYAENFYHKLNNMNPTWWYHTSTTEVGKSETRNFLDENTQKQITYKRNSALKLFSQSKAFSYSFYRTIGNHYKRCNCKLCQFDKDIIKNPNFKKFVEEVTGEIDLKLGTHFYTEYKSGDFLYPHTDSPNGRVAIVLHMTKNWKPWYGGNLNLLDFDWKNIKATLVPKFNSLTIMKIRNNINPHFVEYIPPNVTEKRFAMVCWFN